MPAVTVKECHLCGLSVYSQQKNGRHKNFINKSVQHLWSYLFHHNVRETLSPSITTSSTISTTTTTGGMRSALCNLPKLSFDLYWNNSALLSGQSDVNEDNEVNLQLCDQCSEHIFELDHLHQQLEELKRLVGAQVQKIDNLCQNNCSKRGEGRSNALNKFATHSLFQKGRGHKEGISFAGVSTGKENISQLIKFLTTICEGIPSASSSSFENRPSSSSQFSCATTDDAVQIGKLDTPVLSVTDAEVNDTGTFVPCTSSELDTETGSVSEEIIIDPLADDDDQAGPGPEPGPSSRIPSKIKHLKRRKPKNSYDKILSPQANDQNDRVPCTECGKLIKKKTMWLHRRVHSGVRPFECEFCKMRFMQKSSLNVHRRIHTLECPYTCNFCLRRFSFRRLLVRHLSREHGSKPPLSKVASEASGTDD